MSVGDLHPDMPRRPETPLCNLMLKLRGISRSSAILRSDSPQTNNRKDNYLWITPFIPREKPNVKNAIAGYWRLPQPTPAPALMRMPIVNKIEIITIHTTLTLFIDSHSRTDTAWHCHRPRTPTGTGLIHLNFIQCIIIMHHAFHSLKWSWKSVYFMFLTLWIIGVAFLTAEVIIAVSGILSFRKVYGMTGERSLMYEVWRNPKFDVRLLSENCLNYVQSLKYYVCLFKIWSLKSIQKVCPKSKIRVWNQLSKIV